MAKRIWTICKILVCFALIFCTCFEQNTLAFAQNISLTEEVALKEREDERKVFLGGETVGFELGLNGRGARYAEKSAKRRRYYLLD